MSVYLKHDSALNDEIATWAAMQLPYVGQDGFGPCVAIAIHQAERVIGAVIYHRYMGYDCEISIYTESASWAKRGILKQIFDYPFEQLGVKRLTATIAADNERAQKLVGRLGFVQEGYMRLGFGDQDAILYGMLKHERRY